MTLGSSSGKPEQRRNAEYLKFATIYLAVSPIVPILIRNVVYFWVLKDGIPVVDRTRTRRRNTENRNIHLNLRD